MEAKHASQELNEAISTLAEAPEPILPTFIPHLRRMFSFDEAIAYRVVPGNGCARLDLLHASGFLEVRALGREVERFLETTPGRFAGYDHLRPEADQRNDVRVIDERDLPEPTPLVRLYSRVGLDDKTQLRVLICDGEALVAWVGGFRSDPFDDAEVERFRRLVPALRNRMILERRLADAEGRAAALDVALEAVGTEAYLLDSRGRVVHANRMGRFALDRREDAREALATLTRNAADGWIVTRVESRGRTHHLVVRRANRGDPSAGLSIATAKWNLTARQAEVLSHLVVGRANKTIADLLGCGVGTVELHVSALLQKAGVDNRASLVARFWTEI